MVCDMSFREAQVANQELLLHKEAVSDDGPRTTRSQQFGDRGQ
jgi:hypothetical protein